MKYIYLIQGGPNLYKVGITSNISKRTKAIQTSNPHKIKVVTAKLHRNAAEFEQALHAHLATSSSEARNEWFVLNEEQVVELCILIHAQPEALPEHELSALGVLTEANHNYARIDQKLGAILDAMGKREGNGYVKTPQADSVPTQKELDDAALLERATAIARDRGELSTSLLQRQLRIGYGRAARIMDQLEAAGLISEADGAKPRSVLVG